MIPVLIRELMGCIYGLLDFTFDNQFASELKD